MLGCLFTPKLSSCYDYITCYYKTLNYYLLPHVPHLMENLYPSPTNKFLPHV